jgi:hypothetical protein
VNPLVVHYPAAEPFVRDPSHLVHPDGCFGVLPKLTSTLAKLPRDAFTHIWIVGVFPKNYPAPAGWVPVPDAGSGLLLAAQTEG